MTHRIYENRIPAVAGFYKLAIALDSQVASAHTDGSEIRIWSIGEIAKSPHERLIAVLKTGDLTVSPHGRRKFIATVAGQDVDGELEALHVFDCGHQ